MGSKGQDDTSGLDSGVEAPESDLSSEVVEDQNPGEILILSEEARFEGDVAKRSSPKTIEPSANKEQSAKLTIATEGNENEVKMTTNKKPFSKMPKKAEKIPQKASEKMPLKVPQNTPEKMHKILTKMSEEKGNTGQEKREKGKVSQKKIKFGKNEKIHGVSWITR